MKRRNSNGDDPNKRPKLDDDEKMGPNLFEAIEQNDLEMVKTLLQAGADPNEKNENGDTSLIIATKFKHCEIAKTLLNNNAKVNEKNDDGDDALLVAVKAFKNKNKKMIELFLENGCNPNTKDKNGNTPLILISISGVSSKIAKILLDHGADPNEEDASGTTALFYAFDYSYMSLSELLIKKNAKVKHQNDSKSAFLMAAEKGYVKICKEYLRKKEMNVNEKNEALLLFIRSKPNKSSPLWNVIQLLIENGANASLNDETSNMLLLAIECNHVNMVQWFLKNGVSSIDVINKALGICCHSKPMKTSPLWKIIQLLIENGADPNLNNDVPNVLLVAAERNYPSMVKWLLEKGEINTYEKNKTLSSLCASKLEKDSEKWKIIKILLQKDVGPEFKTERGVSNVILRAAESNHIEMVKWLLKRGVNKNSEDENGTTAFMMAVKTRNFKLMQLLFDRKKLNCQNNEGDSALTFALELPNLKDRWGFPTEYDSSSDEEDDDYSKYYDYSNDEFQKRKNIIKFLIQHGARPGKHKKSPLIIAMKKGYSWVVKLFLKNGVKVDTATDLGVTALMQASLDGDEEMVEFLIEKGSNVNAKDIDGSTPFLFALKGGDADLAMKLIQFGADIFVQDKVGNNALYYSLKYELPEVANKLIKSGVDFHCVRVEGCKPIDFALQKNWPELAENLFKKGERIDYVGEEGENALMSATQKGCTEIALDLIEKRMNAKLTLSNGKELLFTAIEKDREEIGISLIEKSEQFDIDYCVTEALVLAAKRNNENGITNILLEQGADCNRSDKWTGQTPLMYAVNQGSLKIVEKLTEYGADFYAQDNEGKTPIDFSYKKRHDLITMFLLQFGVGENEDRLLVPIHKVKQRIKKWNRRIKKIESVLFPDDTPVIAQIIAEFTFGIHHLQNYIEKHNAKQKKK